MQTKKNAKSTAQIILLAFAALLALLCTFDVQHIAAGGGKVGLATINKFFFKLFGSHSIFDTLSDVLLYLSFLFPAFFGCLALKQLIETKSLKKIEFSLWAFLFYFVMMVILYVMFDKINLNVRPIITRKGIEPSFPSTHTMVSFFFCGTAVTMGKCNLKNKTCLKALEIAFYVIPSLVSLFRLLSGMHWFTDVLGGVLLGLLLVFLHQSIAEKD